LIAPDYQELVSSSVALENGPYTTSGVFGVHLVIQGDILVNGESGLSCTVIVQHPVATLTHTAVQFESQTDLVRTVRSYIQTVTGVTPVSDLVIRWLPDQSEAMIVDRYGNRVWLYTTDGTRLNTDTIPCLRQVPLCATAGGDPYIYPVTGPPTKLPNLDRIYRLYQDKDVVINAHVTQASRAIQREIEAKMQHTGFTPIANNAYFFRRVFVGRTTCTESLLMDLETKQVSGYTSGYFQLNPPTLCHTPVVYDPHTESHVSIPIHWSGCCLQLLFSRNPQVRNGLCLTGIHSTHGDGLFLANYRAKFFCVSDIRCTTAVNPQRNIRRLYTQCGMKKHGREYDICRVSNRRTDGRRATVPMNTEKTR
jgi:hypothetical protein